MFIYKRVKFVLISKSPVSKSTLYVFNSYVMVIKVNLNLVERVNVYCLHECVFYATCVFLSTVLGM